jgi:hypothetical protein
MKVVKQLDYQIVQMVMSHSLCLQGRQQMQEQILLAIVSGIQNDLAINLMEKQQYLDAIHKERADRLNN